MIEQKSDRSILHDEMNFPNLIGLGTNGLTQVVGLGGVMWPKWHHTKLDWWIHFHSFYNWLWLQLIVTDPVDPFSNKIRSSSLFRGSGHLKIWSFLSLYYGQILQILNGNYSPHTSYIQRTSVAAGLASTAHSISKSSPSRTTSFLLFGEASPEVVSLFEIRVARLVLLKLQHWWEYS